MKKNLLIIFVSCLLVNCTMDLGTLQTISTKEYKLDQSYEIALKRQSYEGVSLEDCVNKALKSVPNSAFLRNTSVTTKGKKVIVLTDVWSLVKKKKKPELSFSNKDKKKPSSRPSQISNFKVGMKVSWDHDKAGKGSGIISKIISNQAEIMSIDESGKLSKPIRLPLSVLKIKK